MLKNDKTMKSSLIVSLSLDYSVTRYKYYNKDNIL